MPLVRGIFAPAHLPQTTLPCDTSSSPPSSLTLFLIERHLAPKISKKKYYLLFLFRVSDDNSAPLTKFQLKFYSQTLLSFLNFFWNWEPIRNFLELGTQYLGPYRVVRGEHPLP